MPAIKVETREKIEEKSVSAFRMTGCILQKDFKKL